MATKVASRPDVTTVSMTYRRTHAGIRVWRDDWACDMFEVLTEVEFEETKRVCGRFSIPLREHEEED